MRNGISVLALACKTNLMLARCDTNSEAWNIATVAKQNAEDVWCISLAFCDQLLAAGYSNGHIELFEWDVLALKPIAQIALARPTPIQALSFSYSRTRLAVASLHDVHVYSIVNNSFVPLFSSKQQGLVTSVCWNDNAQLFTSSLGNPFVVLGADVCRRHGECVSRSGALAIARQTPQKQLPLDGADA
jgi:hypothetical protein